jgi:hypothetical protein
LAATRIRPSGFASHLAFELGVGYWELGNGKW